MPFKEGTYKHSSGFKICVKNDGTILVSPGHPLSMRLSDFLDATKWEEIKEE